MKVSGTKVREHRAALVATAKKLLQERGFDRAGVAEISREAGLTQGALYSQFKSKDALAAEACREAFAGVIGTASALPDTAPDALSAFLNNYLSDAHVADAGSGCLLAACVSEVRRQDPAIGAAFAEGIAAMVQRVQGMLPESMPQEEARRRALMLIGALVGSVAMARAVEGANPGLAKDIIAAAREELGQFVVR